MTLAIQDRRPAVLTQESAALLEALRRHRHWLRHSCAAPFVWTLLAPAADALEPAVQAATQDLQGFLAFLGIQ